MNKQTISIVRVFILTIIILGLPNNRVYSQIDTFTISNVDTIHIPTPEKYHSPHKATFYSAIIPGMGQAYNKQYWKIPILYAGLGGIIYGISFNTKYYNKYKNAYRDYIIKDPANKSYLEFAYKAGLTEDDINNADWFEQALKNKKDYYKRNRDFSYIGLLAIYVLNLVDASVDAHFYNYDISDDLTLRIEPTLLNFNSPITETQGFGLQLRLQF